MTQKNNPSQTFSSFLVLDGNSISTEDIFIAVEDPKVHVSISSETTNKIIKSRETLEKFVRENRVIYGVNTSFGGFANWLIPTKNARELQENLIEAVATNVGPYLDDKIVRASMLSRLNSLARGTSGISIENFNKLLAIYNAGIIPCIPSKGSLGASGDLGPLAYIALVAIGRWRAKYKGKIIPGSKALKSAKIAPMVLSFKEGLSLVNGTSAMVGLAAILIEKTITLVKTYDVISCLSFEGLKARKKPFNPVVHAQKPHSGQLCTAQNIWKILEDSQLVTDEHVIEKQLQSQVTNNPVSTETPIEDAYSIRCTPHILGPIRDSLKWIKSIVTNELNSSNDNPLILSESEEIFHNGHFHGQYISMAMDHLAISLTTLANLSDRRIDRFMDKNHSNQLPAFLCTKNPGLRLGFMGGQFMATSLTAESRSLCTPISIQTLTSTGDFQDIVSFGLIAARRAKEIYDNVSYVVAFELLCAAQAVEYRGVNQMGSITKCALKSTRKIVPNLSTDQSLTDYLEDLADFIKSGKLLKEIEKISGNIVL